MAEPTIISGEPKLYNARLNPVLVTPLSLNVTGQTTNAELVAYLQRSFPPDATVDIVDDGMPRHPDYFDTYYLEVSVRQ